MPLFYERRTALKRITALLLVVGLAAALLLVTGCGGDDNSFETPEGRVTVEEPQEEGQGGKLKVESESGETTIEVSEEAPSEEELGVPVYPGAEYVEGSGVSGKVTSGEGGEFETSGAEFTSADGIEQVAAWYRERLGEPMVSTPEETTWIFREESGLITTVILQVEEGLTKITIARLSGEMDIDF